MCAKEHREKLWFELIALTLKILGYVSFMEFNMYDNVKIVFFVFVFSLFIFKVNMINVLCLAYLFG